MKENECPICWRKDVRVVDAVNQENQDISKPLMFCNSCEKHYWGDTNEIVTNLSTFCETFNLSPEICYLKEENPGLSKRKYLSKRRLQEFNLLCGLCSNLRLQLNSGLMNVKSKNASKM
jgi:hypothetical protein